MWSEMAINTGNQIYQKHSPHNPALHITNEGLQIGARYETDMDYCCHCWSDSTGRMGLQRSPVSYSPTDGRFFWRTL